MKGSAIISENGVYRYLLTREWMPSKGFVNFIMLNPSTADADQDDPTIRRCISFADAWGFGGIKVTNLFAYRATNPKDLKDVFDPVGSEWLKWMEAGAEEARMIVLAWGNQGGYFERIRDFINRFHERTCHLGLTKTRQPKHPLYLSKKTIPIFWTETP